ncbi:MAG: hypothetical protein IH612_13755 [Desulfofustis sp.]|nr:hypothetical protein [Desulfofustis sp.]
MIDDSRLLIVGGSGRNVGKTEFVCRLIQKVATRHEVFALKVSAVFPDEKPFHGDHTEDAANGYLFEETSRDKEKDTSRMLRAGARRVFYLRSGDDGILQGFTAFKRQVPPDAVIVCESNSLVRFVNPGLFILVKAERGSVKARVHSLLDRADMVVISRGHAGFPELERIVLDRHNSWMLADTR